MTSGARARSGHPRELRFRAVIHVLAVSVALLVLAKYFAVELYRVPSASMQPTLIGHASAWTVDRVLVDKSRYAFTDPRRWEVAVFRYPLQQRLQYGKRIVGLPGERLRIAGGNIYRVVGDDPARADHLQPLRRPPAVQEEHWLEIFPSRCRLRGDARALGSALQAAGGAWEEGAAYGDLRVAPDGSDGPATLTMADDGHGGLCDRLTDGLPPAVAAAMLGEITDIESVQDGRIACSIVPEVAPARLSIELSVHHPGGRSYRFRMIVEDGVGCLQAEDGRSAPLQSESFDVPLVSGASTRISFAHLDDRCLARIDDEPVASLDTGAFRTLAPLRPSDASQAGRVVLQMSLWLRGPVAITGLRIDRDVHYTTSSRGNSFETGTFDVPADHLFVLGDNPRQSRDSRDWQTLTIRAGIEDNAVLQRIPATRSVTGEWQPALPATEPRFDENPIVLPAEQALVLRDRFGEPWLLSDVDVGVTMPGPDGPGELLATGHGRRFETRIGPEPFVPRRNLLGRAVVVVWPWDRLAPVR